MDTIIRIVESLLFIFVMYKLICEKNKETCFYYYLCGNILLFPMLKLPLIPMPPVLLPLVCIYRSYNDRELKHLWKCYPLRVLTLLMIAYHIVHPFIVSWMPLYSAVRFELYELAQTYLVILGGYLIAPQTLTRRKFIKCLLFLSIVLIVTGGLCWMMGSNFIAAAFSATGDSYFGSDRIGTDRGFRSTGPQFSPNSYGNALVLCILP